MPIRLQVKRMVIISKIKLIVSLENTTHHPRVSRTIARRENEGSRDEWPENCTEEDLDRATI
jgi:hypothetical protein